MSNKCPTKVSNMYKMCDRYQRKRRFKAHIIREMGEITKHAQGCGEIKNSDEF